jgi:EAL and modified HD-GYP domain-containing signal transduction protein
MSISAHGVGEEKSAPCIARQPILSADQQVVGYELLFRENSEQTHFASDVEWATSTAIETLHVVGLDVLCDGKMAFVNCTHQMLMKELFLLLPAGEIVIELQPGIPVDASVQGACHGLRQRGYSIALDNFVPDDTREPLVAYADFIKIDVKNVAPESAAALVRRHGNKNRKMVAVKVENAEIYKTASRNRFQQFQGYFFRYPEHMRARQIAGSQTTYLQLLQAVSRPQTDFYEIEDLIKREPSLCYRLLRYLNSPLLGRSTPVTSIRHALNLLGERELVRWIGMATTLVLARNRPSDLVLSSLVRARFCELIAPRVEYKEADLFLMGMLSLMDAILELPIGIVVETLALDPLTKEQLVCGKSGDTTPLSPIYDLMIAREAGEWETVARLGKELKLSLLFVDKAYNQAMQWAHNVTSATRG